LFSRSYSKVGFNFKLDKSFLGRKQIRIRPDPLDRSYMRSKLSCDVANRIGLPSIQAAYVRLYINNEYWGLYTLMDTVKTSWIKQTFKPVDEEVTTLFQCKVKGMNLTPGTESLCNNANDDYPDMSAFNDFIKQINEATTTEEIEEIMDVEVFLKFMAMEWLIGSFDHLLVIGHNFNFYQRESDHKWVIIEYDYDNTFGLNLMFPRYWISKQDKITLEDLESIASYEELIATDWAMDYYNSIVPIELTFAEWELDLPIIKILVHDNPERFKRIVREVLVSAFNPTILFDHINKLKEFLKPYVIEDNVPKDDGILPGRINKKNTQEPLTMEEFEDEIETKPQFSEGVKRWIKERFENACKQYGFDPEEIINESLKYVPKGYDYDNSGKQVSPQNNINNNPDQLDNDSDCWSEKYGYSCCKHCFVIEVDEYGQWGSENQQWCGIKESVCKTNEESGHCYGATTKEYLCCKGCEVVLTDQNGDWGYENNQWCSISYSC